jgi:hypothetical protein
LFKACFLIEFYLKGKIQKARIISINENERTVEIEWFDIEGDIVYVRGRVISYDNVMLRNPQIVPSRVRAGICSWTYLMIFIVVGLILALLVQLFIGLVDSKWVQLVEEYLECEKKREKRKDSWNNYLFGDKPCKVPEYSDVN